jgi:hypothetical protein
MDFRLLILRQHCHLTVKVVTQKGDTRDYCVNIPGQAWLRHMASCNQPELSPPTLYIRGESSSYDHKISSYKFSTPQMADEAAMDIIRLWAKAIRVEHYLVDKTPLFGNAYQSVVNGTSDGDEEDQVYKYNLIQMEG